MPPIKFKKHTSIKGPTVLLYWLAFAALTALAINTMLTYHNYTDLQLAEIFVANGLTASDSWFDGATTALGEALSSTFKGESWLANFPNGLNGAIILDISIVALSGLFLTALHWQYKEGRGAKYIIAAIIVLVIGGAVLQWRAFLLLYIAYIIALAVSEWVFNSIANAQPFNRNAN